MAKRKHKPGAGRPCKLDANYSVKIVELFRAGKTGDEVAKIIGVAPKTLYNWAKKNTELLLSIREAKHYADDLVENSLYKRARGYTHAEEKVHFDQHGNVSTYNTTKHYPPDTEALKFWLKNRKPAEWRDKQEIDHSNEDGTLQPLFVVKIPEKKNE